MAISTVNRIVTIIIGCLIGASVHALTEGVGIEPQPGRVLPKEMAFTDQHGRRVTLDNYLHNGPVLLSPVWFGCRKMCNFTLSELAKSIDMLDRERNTAVIAVSIDASETPDAGLQQQKKLQKQYPSLDIERNWHFLTASAEVINTLSESTGFKFRYSEQLQQFLHPAATLVLVPDGSISSYLFGVSHQPETIRTQLRLAENGVSVTAPANPLLLLCYRYDSTTGTYTVSILKILRLCALLSLVLLGTYILYNRLPKSGRDNHGA